MKIKIKRLVALYIDYLLIFCISYFPFYYIYKLFNTFLANLFFGSITILLLINLFLRKDSIIGYESIGKKIMRLKIYKNNERVTNKKLLKDRVFLSLPSLPFYLFMILFNNKSSGDIKLGTEVK